MQSPPFLRYADLRAALSIAVDDDAALNVGFMGSLSAYSQLFQFIAAPYLSVRGGAPCVKKLRIAAALGPSKARPVLRGHRLGRPVGLRRRVLRVGIGIVQAGIRCKELTTCHPFLDAVRTPSRTNTAKDRHRRADRAGFLIRSNGPVLERSDRGA